MNDQLEKTKQQNPIEVQDTHMEEQQTLREHLIELQRWDSSETQTVEQLRTEQVTRMIERQTEENERLQTLAQQHLPQGNATITAGGQPQQVQEPARKSFKERQRDKRHDKEARRGNPHADHVSYAISKDLTELKQRRLNSYSSEDRARVERTSWNGRTMDGRVISTFVSGYNKNKKGEPATPQDAKQKARDEIVVRGLSSQNLTERAEALELVTNELLTQKLTDDMFTVEYLEKNMAEMEMAVRRMTAFQDLYSHPHNSAYFNALPQEKKDLIETRILSLYAPAGMLLKSLVESKGVNYETGGYLTANQTANYTMSIQNLPDIMRAYAAEKTQAAIREKELLTAHIESRLAVKRQENMDNAQDMKDQCETDEKLAHLKGLGLTSFVTGYSFDNLAKYRNMIENNQVHYTRNHGVVDTLYHELHHRIDAQGDLLLESISCQNVIDDIRVAIRVNQRNVTPPDQKVIIDLLLERQEAYQAKVDLANQQITEIQDTLEFYLQGKPLSEAGVRVLSSIGITEADIKAESLFQEKARAMESMRKALYEKGQDPQGNPTDSYLERANKTYRDAIANGTEKSLAVSESLQALALRGNKNPVAYADKILRDNIYEGYGLSVLEHLRFLETQKVDLTAISESLQRQRVSPHSPASFAYGGGLDAVNETLLGVAERLILSDESIGYLTTVYSLVKDAEVFEGNPKAAIIFLLQNVINRSCIAHADVNDQQDTFEAKEAAVTVAREAGRSVLALPSLMNKSPEERAALPAATQELVVRFEALLQNVSSRVTGATA